MNKKILSKKYLEGENKYCYCPYCIRRLENEGKNWQDHLSPLVKITDCESIEISKGVFRDYVSSHFECVRCGNTNITENDFVRFYCQRPDGTKYTEPPKEEYLQERYKVFRDFFKARIG